MTQANHAVTHGSEAMEQSKKPRQAGAWVLALLNAQTGVIITVLRFAAPFTPNEMVPSTNANSV